VKPQMKVQAARYGLMKQRPYLATATIRLRLVASEACPHALAASEGWTLYYNPSLVEQTELETLVIQLRREVERLIRRHARRLKSLPREVAETASAMEIDDDLYSEYGSRPDWTLPQNLGLEAGRTAEEYALALLDMLSQSQDAQDGGQDGDSQDADDDDSDAGSSGAVADSSSDEESDGRDGASANAPTPSATNDDGSSANATDSSQGAGTPAEGAGKDQSSHGACGRSRGDSSPQSSSASAGDSSSQQSGASGADGACDAQRPSDASGGDNARDSDSAPESSSQQGSAATGRHAPWETDEEPVSEVEIDQLVESTLRAAAEYAKTRGSQGANMARRYDAATTNKPLPWQRILARHIARGRTYGAGRADFSYARPHRRQSAIPDVVLPTLRQPMLDVVVIVDTSGSITDGELGIALREVQAILKRGGVNEMRVLFGDTSVRAEARVRTATEAVKAFRRVRGGGGTDMGYLVREIVDSSSPKSRPPQLVVVITDGETPWGRAPRTRVPVIAVITPRGRRDSTPAWVKEVAIDE